MVTVQIKTFPDHLHALLKQRAKADGITMSEWAIRELRRRWNMPEVDEWLLRLDRELPAERLPQVDAAAAVREVRGSPYRGGSEDAE
jgi:hypothetical protein